MGFIGKWLFNMFILVLVGLVVYTFLPQVWNTIWALASGVFRPIFITFLLILAGLFALRRA